MSIESMLKTIICETFMKGVGKGQAKKAMLLRIEVPTKAGESGYRQRELLVWAPANYVGVYERDAWDVIPEDELEYDAESDDYDIKRGSPGYRKGASEWKLKCYHDSGWREAVLNFIRTYEKEFENFSSPSWFTVIDPTTENLPFER